MLSEIVSASEGAHIIAGTRGLSRSKVIAVASSAILYWTLRLTAPEVARAAHLGVPYPCFGYGQCHCCSGSTCCESGCLWHSDHSHGCPSGGQCWYTCIQATGDVYQCCDWHSNTGLCICSTLTQITC